MQPCCQGASFLQLGLQEKVLRENWTCFYSITHILRVWLPRGQEGSLFDNGWCWLNWSNSWILEIELWWIRLLFVKSSYLSLTILVGCTLRSQQLGHVTCFSPRTVNKHEWNRDMVWRRPTLLTFTMRKTCLADSLVPEGWEKHGLVSDSTCNLHQVQLSHFTELPTWAQSTLAKSVNLQIYESEKYLFLQDTEDFRLLFHSINGAKYYWCNN